MSVTVIIPTIPPRAGLLARALESVAKQTYEECVVLTLGDTLHEGPAVIRNRMIAQARTQWVAFLDDDDEMYPSHLEWLIAHAVETGADVVYPWFNFHNGTKVIPGPLRLNGKEPFGQPFEPDTLRKGNYIPVTVLVRRNLLQLVGGFPLPRSEEWPHESCEDWGLWIRLLDAGATFSHLPERTWQWNFHRGNTSGIPSRWR